MTRRVAAAVLASVGLVATAAVAAPKVEWPAWARAAAEAPAPKVPDDAKAVTLLDEAVLTVAPDGSRSTRRRSVLRVLKPEGREQAVATVQYQQGGDRLKSFAAWLLNPGAAVRAYGKADVVDTCFQNLLLYSETRTAAIAATSGVVAGGVFAWEAVLEEPPFLAQGQWPFQGAVPVARARFELVLPPGWSASGRFLNHPGVEAARTGPGLVWEIRDLPGWTPEPLDPPVNRSIATLTYDLVPAAAAKKPARLFAFAGWADLVPFARQYVAPATRPTPAVRAKAEQLAQGRARGREQIAALAAYVQQLPYVAIAAKLHTGGGFTPHAADDVLRCGYGDCKDKAALLGTLLAVLGYDSYPVLCFSGDRAAVDPAWPTPLQFNHMLIAIAVGDDVQSPFVVEEPALGRVLLFDPTDRFTPFLDFPAENQGGRVLVCKPGNDRLTTVPTAPPERTSFARRLDVKLLPTGAVDVELQDTARGDAATAQRAFFFEHTDTTKVVDRWLREQVPGAVVGRSAFEDRPEAGAWSATLRFSAANYARAIDGRLLVFKPLVVGRFSLPPLVKPARARPLVVPATRYEFTAEFSLPAGYVVADTGAAADHDTPFGRYTARTTVEDGRLTFHRRVALPAAEFPAARYDEFRAFLELVRKGENTQVVLEKK